MKGYKRVPANYPRSSENKEKKHGTMNRGIIYYGQENVVGYGVAEGHGPEVAGTTFVDGVMSDAWRACVGRVTLVERRAHGPPPEITAGPLDPGFHHVQVDWDDN